LKGDILVMPKIAKINLLLILACGLGAGCPTEQPLPQIEDPVSTAPGSSTSIDAGLFSTSGLDSGVQVTSSQDAGTIVAPTIDAGTTAPLIQDAGETVPVLDGGMAETPTADAGSPNAQTSDAGVAWVDCHGEDFGTAYYDSCLQCVEGNTGLLPCEPDAADAGSSAMPEVDGGLAAVVDAGITLSAEAVAAAGKYLTAYRYLREAILWGATDAEYDLDGDNALGILDVIAARCVAHTQSNGVLFPQMEVGCPVQADVTKFGALIPAPTTECVVDDDCQGTSPGSPRCVVTEASCRCLPIGASGLSECQPTFP
jgi:hypothetical protein